MISWARIRATVDFPLPLSPTSATVSPATSLEGDAVDRTQHTPRPPLPQPELLDQVGDLQGTHDTTSAVRTGRNSPRSSAGGGVGPV